MNQIHITFDGDEITIDWADDREPWEIGRDLKLAYECYAPMFDEVNIAMIESWSATKQ